MNSTPEVEAEKPAGSSRIVIWLVILSLTAFLLPLYLLSSTLKQNNIQLETDLTNIQATMASPPQRSPEEQQLTDQLLQLQQQAGVMEEAQATLSVGHLDWPAVMAVIGTYDQNHMALTSVVQTEEHVLISGVADHETAVMTYIGALQVSGWLDRVSILSITVNAELQTPTPAPEGTPPSAVMPLEFTIQVSVKESPNS